MVYYREERISDIVDRATKKQQELLQFIDGFIKGNGYGPSYREIMRALGYKSVSTVAVHVDGLIARGYLRKRNHSARSIEVVSLRVATPPRVPTDSTVIAEHILWLEYEVETRRLIATDDPAVAEELATLEAALRIFGETNENGSTRT